MKYSQIKEHANTVVAKWERGQSDEAIRATFDREGLYPKDIDEVMILAAQVSKDNLAEKVKAYLLDGTFEQKKKEFESIESNELDGMLSKALQSFSLVATNEIKKMAYAGKSDEEIISKVQNQFVPEEEIREVAAKFRAYNAPRKGKERLLYIVGGVLLILAGLGFLYYLYDEQIFRFRSLSFVFLIGLGFKLLYEAFSSQRVSDQME